MAPFRQCNREKGRESQKERESLLVKCALLEPRHSPFQQCSRERERERERERYIHIINPTMLRDSERERESERKGERVLA